MFKIIDKLNKKPLLNNLFFGLITATFFSAFIYLEHYGFTIKILNTLFGIISLAMLLYINKRAILIAGFSIGILWFYWIGYSFEYNGVGFMTPIITFAFGIIYMLFFGVLALTKKVYIRAILLFILSFVEPFDWNWLQIELIFVDSYIGIFKYQLAIVLVALTLPAYIKKPFKYTPLLLILLAFNFQKPTYKTNNLKIKLISTNIPQEKKWLRESFKPTVKLIFSEIKKAKKESYDIVVFPESVFPIFLNRNQNIINSLLKESQNISIVVGSLLRDDSKSYNVTYIFNNGKYTIAKKLVLVPFGEYIPLPKFARKIINDTFFAGQSDFETASKPTDFIIKGVKFRNAICYEATCQEIYDGDVDFVIASSNNAWFKPSIEPTIQKLLMRFYARKNSTTIYHSVNGSVSGVIK